MTKKKRDDNEKKRATKERRSNQTLQRNRPHIHTIRFLAVVGVITNNKSGISLLVITPTMAERKGAATKHYNVTAPIPIYTLSDILLLLSAVKTNHT